MKRIFTAAIAVAVIASAGVTQAQATTFPSLTRIYFASGALDSSLNSGNCHGRQLLQHERSDGKRPVSVSWL